MTEQEDKELIAGRIMEDQLKRRMILMEDIYKCQILELEAEVTKQNERAMDFWRALIQIRVDSTKALM